MTTPAAPLPDVPGLVIVEPAAHPDQVPYEKVNRVPEGPLQDLEGIVAGHLGVHTDQLVGREGIITDHGSALLLERRETPGTAEPDAYVVVSYDSREGRLQTSEWRSEDNARNRYDRAVAVLHG